MKYLYVSCVFFFFLNCKKKDITVSKQDKLDIHFDQAYNLDLSVQDRIKHVDSANLLLINKAIRDSLKLKNVFKIANRYYALLEHEKYLKSAKEALSISKKIKDTSQIAKAEYYIGDYFFNKSESDSAFYYYKKAKDKYEKLSDKYNLAITNLHLARVLLFEKDFLGSEIETIKALKIANEIEDKVLVYECYDNLGRVLEGQRNLNKSLEYFNLSLNQINKIDNEINLPLFKAQTLNNIGHVYLSAGDYNNAKKSFFEGLQIDNLIQLHPALYSSLLDHLAYSKFKLGISSLEDFNLSMKVRDSINDVVGKISSRIHLTEYHLSNKDTLKAKLLNQQAYNLARKSKYNSEVLTTLDLFTKIEPKNGLQYAKEYIKLSDSLQEQERNTRNKLARIEFETDQIIVEKEAITNKLSSIVLISLIVFSIGSLLYVVLYLRSRQKQLFFAHEQQLANEKIYQMMLEQQTKIDEARTFEKKRIARELHDGVMNKLASTRLNLFVLNKRTDEETIKNCLPHINEIQNIEKEVRSIAHELKAESYTNNNFKNVLSDFLKDQEKIFDANFQYEYDENIPWEVIDTKIKMNLFRILQEALNNANKYAEAKNIYVKIAFNDKKLFVEISDDGKGFVVSKKKKGIGIKNMQERANDLKADFKITSKENKGTKISLHFNTNKRL